jgi:regulator of cell morphogenesis and NO signaling
MNQAIAAGTVGEWAAKSLRVVLILEGYGIEHHAEESVPLEEACLKRGLDPVRVQAELEAAASFRKPVDANWAEMPLDELSRHIEERHHEYLRLELPRLRARLNKMQSKHGERDNGLLNKLHAVFSSLQEGIDAHLAGKRLEQESTVDALAKIREITRDFDPPGYACPNFKGVYVSLQELEGDLKEHLRLENDFLLPRSERKTT